MNSIMDLRCSASLDHGILTLNSGQTIDLAKIEAALVDMSSTSLHPSNDAEHERLVDCLNAAQVALAELCVDEGKKATPRQLEAEMKHGCPKEGEVERLYAARRAFLDRLHAIGSVTLQDVQCLDRLGRAQVASDLWALSDADARHALLNDVHHQVRACAVISNQGTASPGVCK